MEIVNLQFSDGMVMKRPSIYGMLFFFFLADPFAGVDCQPQIETLLVPSAVRLGENARLECLYRLNGKSLYKLSWYKDHREFFSYMPQRSPPKLNYGGLGLHVNMENSTAHTVILMNMEAIGSGVYRCVVSVEAPNFETDYRDAILRVIEPPKGNPFITLAKGTLGPREFLLANCSGPKGRPTPQLVWTIASRQVEENFTEVTSLLPYNEKEGNAVQSSLRYPAHLLPVWPLTGGDVFLQLRCISRVYGFYEKEDTVTIQLRQPSTSLTTKTPSHQRPVELPTSTSSTDGQPDTLRSNSGSCVSQLMPVSITILMSLLS